MDGSAKWWCIHFGQEQLDARAAKKMQVLFKRITPHVVFGKRRVFLNVTQSEWKKSLHLLQTKLGAVAKKLNLNSEVWQWGVGSSLAESWVQARWRTLSPELLPIEAVSDYLNPFEFERKSPDENRRLRLLRSLQINTLQDLIDTQEDLLLSQCGLWISDFVREHFSKPQEKREHWLEKATAESFMKSNRPFQLEDWIPDEYLQVG